ncbi:MAG: sigma-70 family RNA polymerase sigma factor [Nonlabens sp.]|nr:sigma-70 family RNA polymerase sigma factor [Nonlabens sp.]MDP5101103.1 sigma-70 family RNA polymerase sigma factor [Nonlabens sp.]
MSTNSEQELIALLRNTATQDAGYRLLVRDYGKRLYWQIRKIVLDHEDADDVLQNVFVKIFKGFHNFKADSKLSTWLFRIAYNESMTFLSNKAKTLKISSQELQDFLVNSLEADVYFTGDEIQLELQKALATLPDRQKEIFNMRYYDDLKFQDIAKILDLTEGAVKSSYHIAAKKIEAFIKRE